MNNNKLFKDGFIKKKIKDSQLNKINLIKKKLKTYQKKK